MFNPIKIRQTFDTSYHFVCIKFEDYGRGNDPAIIRSTNKFTSKVEVVNTNVKTARGMLKFYEVK